ncbi:hypothetical protein [Larkinella harenae]
MIEARENDCGRKAKCIGEGWSELSPAVGQSLTIVAEGMKPASYRLVKNGSITPTERFMVSKRGDQARGCGAKSCPQNPRQKLLTIQTRD